MKYERKRIAIKLELDEGEVTLYFRRMKKNARNKFIAESKKLKDELQQHKDKSAADDAAASLLSVELVYYKSQFNSEIMKCCDEIDWSNYPGDPFFSLEDVHTENLDEDLANTIIAAYEAATAQVVEAQAQEADSKNGDRAGALQTA